MFRVKRSFCLSHIGGISHALNDAIYRWYDNSNNQNVLHALIAELEFIGEQKEIEGNKNPFREKHIVVTGTFQNFDRAGILALLEALGAITHDRVDKSIDFLIYGEAPGSKKLAKAMENGVPMIGEEKFAKMLEQNV